MASKYIDTISVMQVIGCCYNNPSLLDLTDKYTIIEEDFVQDFHKVVFGSILKLHDLGVDKITLENISDFLSSRPKSEAIFKLNKGEEWLIKISEKALSSSFDYYYQRLKKFTLLREYDKLGVDVTDIYDPDNLMDVRKKQVQEEYLDNSSLTMIADRIDNKISEIRMRYAEGDYNQALSAGEGIDSLIDRFKEHPEVGIPLYGSLVNTVTRGARLKKFYLRSAATGVGKSRAMIADVCYIGCEEIYDERFGWIRTGPGQPVLYISTEMELEEVQTMMIAFLSNVNEEHILNGELTEEEEERCRKAVTLLKQAPIYVEELPDFSLQDVENTIKRNIRDNGVRYAFHDYIHSSLKILEEVSRRSNGVKLREDNVLFMLSTKMKDICNKYGVFILSATQLSGEFNESKTPDQNFLRGAKSIGDKVDVGELMLRVSDDDLVALEPILGSQVFDTPNLKISVYKNRRGRYKGVYLWCKADLGVCRIQPMFCTTWGYEMVSIDDIRISLEEPGAFEEKEVI